MPTSNLPVPTLSYGNKRGATTKDHWDWVNRAQTCLRFLTAQALPDAVIAPANSTPPIARRKKEKLRTAKRSTSTSKPC